MRTHVEVYRDSRGDWRWRLRADNGRVIAVPGQGYSRRIDMMESMALALGGSVTETASSEWLMRPAESIRIERVE